MSKKQRRRQQQQQQQQQRQKEQERQEQERQEQERQQQEQQQKESSWGHWFSNVFSSTQNATEKSSSTPAPSLVPAEVEEDTDQPNFWSKTKENIKSYFDNISFDGMFNKFSEFISSIFEKITSVFETISKLINSFFNFAKNTKTGFDQMKTDFEGSKSFIQKTTEATKGAKSFFSKSSRFFPRAVNSSTGDEVARNGFTSGK